MCKIYSKNIKSNKKEIAMEKDEQKKLHKEIGQRLKAARISHGYTQEQIAEKLGINTAYYGKVERGISGLTILNIRKVSEILGIDIHFLITGVGKNKLEYEGIIKNLPLDKRYDFEQLIKYALNLAYEKQDKE